MKKMAETIINKHHLFPLAIIDKEAYHDLTSRIGRSRYFGVYQTRYFRSFYAGGAIG
jgi:hypothetical protein